MRKKFIIGSLILLCIINGYAKRTKLNSKQQKNLSSIFYRQNKNLITKSFNKNLTDSSLAYAYLIASKKIIFLGRCIVEKFDTQNQGTWILLINKKTMKPDYVFVQGNLIITPFKIKQNVKKLNKKYEKILKRFSKQYRDNIRIILNSFALNLGVKNKNKEYNEILDNTIHKIIEKKLVEIYN